METQLKSNVAVNLMRVRVARRCSQREIAAVLSIKQSSYRDIEIGNTQINAVRLAILADFYRIPVQAFFEKGMATDAAVYNDKETGQRMNERLFYYKTLIDVYSKRLAELESKLRRRDAKIEALQSMPRRLSGES